MLSQELVKWLITLLTSALSAIVVTCRKQIAEFFKFRERKRQKELLSGVNRDLNNLEHLMENHEDEVAIELQEHDQEYAKKLLELEEKIMKILLPMQKALLSSHYEALLNKCKYYVSKGEITADELDLLERDYETYHDLGGNGHMELWMRRVRQLKVI